MDEERKKETDRMLADVPAPVLIAELYGRDQEEVARQVATPEDNWRGMFLADERDRLGSWAESVPGMLLQAADSQYEAGMRSNGYEDLSRGDMRSRALERLFAGIASSADAAGIPRQDVVRRFMQAFGLA